MDLELYEKWCGTNGGFNQKVAYTGEFEDIKAIKKAGKNKLSWQFKKSNTRANVILIGDQPDMDFVEKVKKGAYTPPLLIDEATLLETLCRPLPWFGERWYARAGGSSDNMKLVGASKKELEESFSMGRQLVYASVGEPASEDAIAAAEQRLGVTFDATLRDIYRQANGLMLGSRFWKSYDDSPVSPLAPSEHPEDPGVDSRFFMASHVDNQTFWRLDGSDASGWSFGALCIPSLDQLESWESYYGMDAPSKKHEGLIIFDACYGYNPAFVRFERGVARVYCASDHGADVYSTKMDVAKYLDRGIDLRGNRRTWWSD